jgi:two-component system sensor histidine kinase BarA
VRHLAAASAHFIASSNVDLFKPVAQELLSERDVESVTIVDNQGSVLLQSQASNKEDNALSIGGALHHDNLIFMKPIYRDPNPDAVNGQRNLANNIIGWAIVELSKNPSRTQQYWSLIDSVVITLLMVVLSFGVIYRISKKITAPILQISQAANEIEKGNFDVDINTGSKGELLTLERNIKSMASSLKKSRDELQNKIDEATTNLLNSIQVVERQNKELTAARREALLASKVKSEFLANMSHEIRTPMNGILGFAKLLKKTNPSSEQNDYIETIQRSADNLLTIINDILDISKIEAGKISLQNTDYHLRDCLEDVIALLAPSAYEKRLNLVSMVYNDVPVALHGDVSKVRQILTNLISNAIKFTEKGNVIVRTMLESEYGNKVKIKISVTDTGIGISSKSQHRVFATFEQVDSSATRKHGGTGLGLSISKSLAELMQGEIGFDSEPDKGSTFWCSFTHELQAENTTSPTDNALLNEDLTGHKALLYETNHAARLAISHLLENWGVDFDTAQDLDTVYKFAELSKRNDALYDFILLGLSYSEMQPDTFAPIYQHLCHLSKSHIVCLINSADAEQMAFFRSLGVSAAIPKPPKHSDFYTNLRTLSDPNIVNFAHAKATRQWEEHPEHDTLKDATDNDNRALPAAMGTQGVLQGVKILIAEDHAINARLVENILDQAGADIHLVADGKQAVEANSRSDFDLILMDIHMPELSGVEATKRIRGQGSPKSNIPIIALTADAMPEDQKQFLNAGLNDVLVKPVNEETLIHKITQFVKPVHAPGKNQTDASQPPLKAACKKNETTNAFAREMEELLVAELPHFKRQIMQTHADKDWPMLYEHIHKLHGAASYCDLPDLTAQVKSCETALKKRHIRNLAEHVNAVVNEIDAILGGELAN